LKTFVNKTALGKPFNDYLDIKGSYKLLKDFVELDLSPILPYIRKEVFVLHGLHDPVVPYREALKLVSLLRNAKLKTLPGGHFPIKDEKDIISAVF